MKLKLGGKVSVCGLPGEILAFPTVGSVRVKLEGEIRTVPRTMVRPRGRGSSKWKIGRKTKVKIDGRAYAAVVVRAGTQSSRPQVEVTEAGPFLGAIVEGGKTKRELGMVYTMEEYHHWHRSKPMHEDPDAPPHEDNKVCLSPSHEAAYLAIRAAKQADGESTWGERPSQRAEQAAGGYRFGRRGMMGVGR